MSNFIRVCLGQTLKKKGISQGDPGFENNTFEPRFWLTEEQIAALRELAGNDDWPTPILGFEIVRGALHGRFTRIRPLCEDGNWGKDCQSEYYYLLDRMAEILGWYHYRLDGANVVIKQSVDDEYRDNTWLRWKRNNPASHLREAAEKNWGKNWNSRYNDEEWDNSKFDPLEWRKNYQARISETE